MSMPVSSSDFDQTLRDLTQLHQWLQAQPALDQEEMEEKQKLLDIVSYHLASALEWSTPEGLALAHRQPELLSTWRDMIQSLFDLFSDVEPKFSQ